MKPTTRQHEGSLRICLAFSRIELLALLVALIVLAGVALPLGSSQRTIASRSEELVCQANLRHIGRAFQLWGSDHDDQKPFLLDPSDGGIRGFGPANNVWYQFAYISNELATPRVLVCPSDTNTTRIAKSWANSPDGGFLNPLYRNNSVSYFLSFHAFRDDPRALLAGDRNMQANGSGACSYAGLSFVLVYSVNQQTAIWSNSIHGLEGNILFNDATVATMSSTEVQNAIGAPATDSARIHFLLPR